MLAQSHKAVEFSTEGNFLLEGIPQNFVGNFILLPNDKILGIEKIVSHNQFQKYFLIGGKKENPQGTYIYLLKLNYSLNLLPISLHYLKKSNTSKGFEGEYAGRWGNLPLGDFDVSKISDPIYEMMHEGKFIEKELRTILANDKDLFNLINKNSLALIVNNGENEYRNIKI